MTKRTLDCRGLACPKPVVNTKKTLEALEEESADFTLTAVVDNEAALKNVTRFAEAGGYQVSVQKEGDAFHLVINKPAAAPKQAETVHKDDDAQPCPCSLTPDGEGTVLLITGSTLGRGEEELGKLLMRSFIFSLRESDVLPEKMMFLNSGVYLTTTGSPVLEELQELSDRGVELFSCGTCLEYYQLKDELAVGEVTNMYNTVASMLAPYHCITV